MLATDRLFDKTLNLHRASESVMHNGYSLAREAVAPEALELLSEEAEELILADEADRYHGLDDDTVHQAAVLSRELAKRVMMHRFKRGYERLREWQPNEISYQELSSDGTEAERFRNRPNESIIRAIVSLSGEVATELLPEEDDISRENSAKSGIMLFRPGDILFLRAPGLGNGHRSVYKMSIGDKQSATIINLRMT